MAIPSRQIGWSTTDNLLWQISKQLQYLTGILYNGTGTTTTTTSSTSTTTTTTTAPPAPGTLYLSSLSVINACAQTGTIYPITGVTYNTGTGLCDSVAMTSNDILGLAGNTTYYASDGTNARAGFKAGGAGVDLITFTGPCFAC